MSARRTTIACPIQWEGKLDDGREFYLRERHNVARLDVPYGTEVRRVEVADDDLPGSLEDFVQMFPELEIAEGAVIDADAWERYEVGK